MGEKKTPVYLLLVMVVYCVACVGVPGLPTSEPEEAAPVVSAEAVEPVQVSPISVPEAETPEPTGTPELHAALEGCQGEKTAWGDYQIQMCNGLSTESLAPEGTVLFFVAASTFAFKASDMVPVASVTSATGTVGFLALAQAGAPVLTVIGVVTLPVLSVYQFMANPPTANPLLEQWLANRYPTLALSLAAAGVNDQVGILDLPERFVTDAWDNVLKNFRIKNPMTAIVLEDDEVLATASYLTLQKLGFTVVGIFPSCETWMATKLVANLYVLDNMMKGWMRAPECAREIHTRSPLSIVLIYSSASPDDPYKNGKTLREFVEESMGKNQTIGAEKTSTGVNLAKEIMRFFGGS